MTSGGSSGVAPIPGMFVFPASNGQADSDTLHYSRHEFSTYFLQHQERQPHAVDSTDRNWHLDGSRHVDHDHLILAIMGSMNDGSLPRPGATPAFDLTASAYSLFYQGVVGTSSVSMNDSAAVDSYSPMSGSFGHAGDVFTNGTLTLMKNAIVDGNAVAGSFAVSSSAIITGARTPLAQPSTFMDVKLPAGLPNLGTIDLSGNPGMTIVGPGSFEVGDILLNKAELYVDNSAGPVTLYVTGQLVMQAGARIALADPDPEKFAVYLPNAQPVYLQGGCSAFNGVVYAPYSTLAITSKGEFFGAFVAQTMKLDKNARVHYWSPLRGQ
jgi:hypothetical protein